MSRAEQWLQHQNKRPKILVNGIMCQLRDDGFIQIAKGDRHINMEIKTALELSKWLHELLQES